ncbi:hypothetical protein EJB05_45799, partial [Eragrostis curvula]
MDDDFRCRTRTKRPCHGHSKSMFKKSRPKLQFLSVPADIQRLILSKLPLKEVTRTSVLSTKWRSVCTFYPKLRFDGITMCSSRSLPGSEQYIKEFIRNVDAVLQQHNGEFVEDFQLKFEFNSELITHLDKWVRFAAASQAKNIAFDLVPAKFRGRYDRYLLPHELLASQSTHRLQSVQLGFVSIKLPSKFSGFPNLRKLDLHFIDITANELEDMLSSCSNLEWLSVVRCHVHDELKVDLPLPRLLYLCVAYCRITRIKFNAMKLKTFVCAGSLYPFDLSQSLELKDAHFCIFDSLTLDYALVTLPTVLPSVENLTLQATATLKTTALLESSCKLSCLKYLQLELFVSYEDADNIISLSSCLRAAPLIEKFELHFSVTSFAHYDREPLRSLPRCPHNYLKNLCITGFTACTGQLEFLLYAVENAPLLEVLTLDPACKFGLGLTFDGQASVFSWAREVSRRHLTGRILPTTKLYLLYSALPPLHIQIGSLSGAFHDVHIIISRICALRDLQRAQANLNFCYAHFYVYDSLTLDYALVTLPTVLPSAENFSVQASAQLKTPARLENACKFSQLKYLQLELFVTYEDASNILSLASYLRAALIEKFEMHFSVCSFALSDSDLEPLKSLPLWPYNYLKTLYITGFTACTGQLEFLLHAVENAPIPEDLTLDPACSFDRGMMESGDPSEGIFARGCTDASGAELALTPQ